MKPVVREVFVLCNLHFMSMECFSQCRAAVNNTLDFIPLMVKQRSAR